MSGLYTIPYNASAPANPSAGYITTYSNNSGMWSWVLSTGVVVVSASPTVAQAWNAAQDFTATTIVVATATLSNQPVTLAQLNAGGSGAKLYLNTTCGGY